MGKPYRGDVTVLEDDFPTWSKEPILVESHLEEAPSESCVMIVWWLVPHLVLTISTKLAPSHLT